MEDDKYGMIKAFSSSVQASLPASIFSTWQNPKAYFLFC